MEKFRWAHKTEDTLSVGISTEDHYTWFQRCWGECGSLDMVSATSIIGTLFIYLVRVNWIKPRISFSSPGLVQSTGGTTEHLSTLRQVLERRTPDTSSAENNFQKFTTRVMDLFDGNLGKQAKYLLVAHNGSLKEFMSFHITVNSQWEYLIPKENLEARARSKGEEAPGFNEPGTDSFRKYDSKRKS